MNALGFGTKQIYLNHSFMRYLLIICLFVYGLVVNAQTPWPDKPFTQTYSVKYYTDKPNPQLTGLACDRNGTIQLLADGQLLTPTNGQFLRPGNLRPDVRHRSMSNRRPTAIGLYDNQLVYLDERAVWSNAWAGKLWAEHQLPGARLFVGGPNFTFLVSDGRALHLVREGRVLWQGTMPDDEVIALRFQPSTGQYWLLGRKTVQVLAGQKPVLTTVFAGTNFTAFDFTDKGQKLAIGTSNGYWLLDAVARKPIGSIQQKLPVPEITALAEINGRLWFGSPLGAFALQSDGGFDYFNGERWLPNNAVTGLAADPNGAVLVLTQGGLARLETKQMTLHEKAQFFDNQVRSRHIRHGFNASLAGMEKGNLDTGYLEDSDNDGLWTSMYLGSQVFRYAATKDPEALQNCRESLDAMERLYAITPVPGFPARSFEREGLRAKLADSDRWQPSPQAGWDWKSTTSSDEVIGHVFAFGAIAELIEEPKLRKQAVSLLDTLMSHILRNDLYLIDFDGKPTRWGRWNPTYVNALPTNVGDRKLNSSNLIAMLQTAWRFTQKEKYRQKAFELMEKHGYLTNLLRPMREIGEAPASASADSKMLSDSWNHSDDEMYFLGYWGLYRYAFNDTLRVQYKQAILDHWQAERPEQEAAWNLFTALTGTPTYDRDEAIAWLQNHPLDLIDWRIQNSHRKDLEFLPPNFRKQTTRRVLPPSERPIQRHNANQFILDRTSSNGTSEHSAGDIWLLPYWLGRYLGVISEPIKTGLSTPQPPVVER